MIRLQAPSSSASSTTVPSTSIIIQENKKQGQKKNVVTPATTSSSSNIVNNSKNCDLTQSSNSLNPVKSIVKVKRKLQKKSSCRKNYKKLKSKFKGLIEEGIMLKETLKRKQEQLVEMSRDIHYVLGRLLPYQNKLASIANNTTMSSLPSSSTSVAVAPTTILPSSSITTTTTGEATTMSKPIILPEDCTPSSSSATIGTSVSETPWDYVSCQSSTILVDTGKNRINFPLTLPDDIFSES